MVNHLFVVGAQRSGTTYLYHTLNQHPQIEMAKPAIPEPKYFLKKGSENRLDTYLTEFFEGKPGIAWRGEKSASYIECEAAAARLAKAFPDAMILFILRDPVARAISNYWYTRSYKLEDQPITVLTDERAQRRPYSNVSVSPFSYLNRGKYVEYIDMYTNYFPKEQMKILLHEDFVQGTDALADLYQTLGIDASFVPPCAGRTVNESAYGPEPTPEFVFEFLREYYAEYNDALANRYGVNTASWQRPVPAIASVTMLEENAVEFERKIRMAM